MQLPSDIMILTAVCAQISISETRGAMLHCFISMPVALNILCLDNPLVGLALFVHLFRFPCRRFSTRPRLWFAVLQMLLLVLQTV
jgi:hypothetical protein